MWARILAAHRSEAGAAFVPLGRGQHGAPLELCYASRLRPRLELSQQDKRPRPQTAQVLPRKVHNARTNKVVQEEAGGLLYALLFVLFGLFALRLQPPRSPTS